jgi:hypothetical protein
MNPYRNLPTPTNLVSAFKVKALEGPPFPFRTRRTAPHRLTGTEG